MDEFNPVWMEQALELAVSASIENEVPVGAIIVHDGLIIGKGYNKREQDNNPLAHAEMIAIREASQFLRSWRLVNCILIVTLEPCPMCLAAAQQARLSQVIYGAIDSKGGALSLGYRLNEDVRTNHRFAAKYIETPECSQILKAFFRNCR